MPEGPEVRVVANELSCFIGLTIILMEYLGERRIYTNMDLLPCPAKIIAIRAVAKKLIFTLADGSIIVSSLGLTGHWSYTPQKHNRMIMCFGSISHGVDARGNKLIMQHIKYALYYSDKLCRGANIRYIPHTNVTDYMATLGPDILARDVSSTEWMTIFTNKKVANWEVCKLLIDPSKIGGIGNYLRAEILYHARIAPQRKVSTLTTTEIELLRIHAHNTIRMSYKYGGLTISDYWSPSGARGTFPKQVYEEEVDSHGNRVEVYVSNRRKCYWVPAVQK